MHKLKKVEFHMLKNRLSPDWLIKHTEIFNEGYEGRRIAAKFREYWNSYILPDLEKLLDDHAKRLNQ